MRVRFGIRFGRENGTDTEGTEPAGDATPADGSGTADGDGGEAQTSTEGRGVG